MVFSSKKKKANKTHLKKSENKKNSNSKRTNKRKNKGLRKRTKNKKGGAKSPLIASASTILSLIEHMDKELEFLNRDDSTVTYIQCRQCLTKSYKMMEKIEENRTMEEEEDVSFACASSVPSCKCSSVACADQMP